MDKEEENKTTEAKASQVYPNATRGSLSDNHSTYNKPVKWAGGDPDKYTRVYFVAFLIIISVLFVLAVKSLSSDKFLF